MGAHELGWFTILQYEFVLISGLDPTIDPIYKDMDLLMPWFNLRGLY